MIRPTAQLRANHRPSEEIPPGVHPVNVVIIHEAPRSYVGMVAVVLAASGGAAGVGLVLAHLIDATSHLVTVASAAIPAASVGGITVKLGGRK